jgi:Methyltransferase FkbM domain
VRVHCCAVAGEAGRAHFTRDLRGKGGSLSESVAGDRFEVEVVTLDGFCVSHDGLKVDVIKLDAAGNELAAVEGGARLLTSTGAPTLLIKFYHPQVVRERFGVYGSEVRRLLEEWGFRLFRLARHGAQPFDGRVASYGILVLASRDPKVLRTISC